ncbi:MAG: hypothetical protein PUD59_04050 [bacterium]|nr:hypothetical protein [bacterium]
MKDNKDVLNELNKGCTMGMDALKFVLEKVKDEYFKKQLEDQYNTYDDIHKKVEKLYEKYSQSDPRETNAFNKAMTWSVVEMKTINDTSNSKIAEILLQGTNMGIIEGRRLLNNKDNLDEDVKKVLSEYVKLQEKYVESLKKYL